MTKLTRIYECFCDPTRLRILQLLTESPLCVCHFQEILGEPQVKVSKHLAYLRSRGVVMTQRHGNWMIYSLPKKRSAEMERNLRCLQECTKSDSLFQRDRAKLARLRGGCCEPAELFGRQPQDSLVKKKR